MLDEQTVENEAVVVSPTESPTVKEEATAEIPSTEIAPKEESEQVSEVNESEVELKPEVKPVEKRIHKLVDERDRERARAESLAKQVEDLTNQFTGQNQSFTTNPTTIEPGAEVTQEQYQADVARQADAIVQIRLNQERIVNNINKEALDSMTAHPELDPSSDVFDKELSDTIVESVKAQIQVNPAASVKKLVNHMMKPYRRSIEQKVAETTETITKQVSESALRPSQVKTLDKPFDKLSTEEMEARLGTVS